MNLQAVDRRHRLVAPTRLPDYGPIVQIEVASINPTALRSDVDFVTVHSKGGWDRSAQAGVLTGPVVPAIGAHQQAINQVYGEEHVSVAGMLPYRPTTGSGGQYLSPRRAGIGRLVDTSIISEGNAIRSIASDLREPGR